jgi:hypothetical protein
MQEVMAQCPGPVTTRPARAVMFIVKMGKSIYPQGTTQRFERVLVVGGPWFPGDVLRAV